MQALLFHVSANSLGILGGASTVIAVLSFAACFLPVYRASRVLPMQALAAE